MSYRTLRLLSIAPLASLVFIACGGSDDPAASNPASTAGSGGTGQSGQAGQANAGTAGATGGMNTGGMNTAGKGGSAGGTVADPETVACGTNLPKAATGVCDVQKGTSGVLIRGRVIGADKVYDGGEVLIGADGIITCAACDCSASAGYAAATKVTCADGVVSPGLINTHEHLTYAHNPPKTGAIRYDYRNEWRKGSPGKPAVNVPSNSGKANETDTVWWGEIRQLLAGATSISGESGTAKGGLLRNIDKTEPQQEGLMQGRVDQSVFPLGDTDGKIHTTCDYMPQDTQATIDKDEAYEPHVSEGITDNSHLEFVCMSGATGSHLNALKPQSAYIHAVATTATDLNAMAAAGTGLVWSPRSNVSLYGHTAPVTLASRVGVQIALGTDWSASGGMNILRELACAADLNATHYGGYFSDYQLYRMVTIDAAALMASDDKVGALKPGLIGDIAVFASNGNAAFSAVVRADVKDVNLVLRGGKVLYGEAELVDALSPDGGAGCEALTQCLSANKVCAKRETAKTVAEIQSAIGSPYALFFCGAPDQEPTCVPSRPGEFTGVASADDPDGDGIPSATDLCPTVFSAIRPMDKGKQLDTDGDGVGDHCDPCPLKANSTDCALVQGDLDGDGVEDAKDNCPNAPNMDQADKDGDAKGDACDPCPDAANPGAAACPAQTMTIPMVRGLADGANVSIKGVCVTALRGTSSVTYWVQDPTLTENAGLVLFAKSDLGLAVGDRVDVSGLTATFNGLKELNNPMATKVGTGCDVTPKVVPPASIATMGADTQKLMSMLLKVDGVAVTTAGSAASGNEFTVTGDLQVDDFIYVFDPATYPVGTQLTSLTGVLDYFKDHSKLCPRTVADITK